jgi:cytochrome c-type biogenesis protein CcmE
MKPRQQRMLAVGLAVAGVAIAAGLTLKAFDENMMFFVEISDVVAGEYPQERNFRIGGLVVEDSIEREEGSRDRLVRVTDLRGE